MALALLGLGLAAVFQLVAMQGRAQTQARLHLEALRQAQNLLDQWLDEPRPRLGVFQGVASSGLEWRVEVRRVASGARRISTGAGQGRTLPGARPTSRRVPALWEISVCCRYQLMGRSRRVCLASQRLVQETL